jgi:3-oxoacyl-[acyl-carrier protein] reductase
MAELQITNLQLQDALEAQGNRPPYNRLYSRPFRPFYKVFAGRFCKSSHDASGFRRLRIEVVMTPNPNPRSRVALVTGAAGGIGDAVAEAFASRGYAIAITDRCADGLAHVERALLRHGADVLSLAGDLADLDFAESLVRRTATRFGRIDVLVNNAAARELTTMRDITPAEWDRTLRVCLTAPAFLARWAAAEMPPGGVIVNIGSMMARQAHGISPAYIACKGALESLTYDLAALYGPDGIRVVTVAPGAIDTAMSRFHDADGRPDGREDDPVREFSESMAMLGRWGRPEEVARAVAWVASDEASYLTGTTLVLDGGWSRMHMPPQVTQALLPEAAHEPACLTTARKD